MPLSFLGAAKAQVEAAEAAKVSAPTTTMFQPQNGSAPKPSNLSWMKPGAAAALAADDKMAEERAAESNKMRRFHMKGGEERQIIFLDGVIGADGVLEAVSFYEHTILHHGNYENIICTQHEGSCPVCNGGDRPALMFALTIINATPYTIQKGQNAGKVIPWQVQLFVCKKETFKVLNKHAAAHGQSGLTGVGFNVSRTGGNKSARVGDVFIPAGNATLAEILSEYQGAKVASYMEELVYRDAATLVQMGLGKQVATIGGGGNFGINLPKGEDVL